MLIFLIIVLVCILLICILLMRPVNTRSLVSKPSPIFTYQESQDRIQQLRSCDGSEVSDDCHAILLTHGKKTDKTIVMYHGYTNCPRQYEKLAGLFFERGYNVYVPRIPYHGNRDLNTKEIAHLTIHDLTRVCDETVDMAQGLGEQVTVLGLSMGGIMASWNAQVRHDVATSVVIVPSFAWYFLPRVITPLINLSQSFPNMHLWWDPIKRKKRTAPHTMYYKFSTRAMAHVLRLGLAVLRRAQKQKPGAKRIIMITNEMDRAVDEATMRFLLKQWRAHGTPVDYFSFSTGLKMEHDIIDPEHPYEKTDQVYQKIFDLLEPS